MERQVLSDGWPQPTLLEMTGGDEVTILGNQNAILASGKGDQLFVPRTVPVWKVWGMECVETSQRQFFCEVLG